MRIRRRSGGRTRAFAWLMALMMLTFMMSARGQTSTAPRDNAEDPPPANAPEEDAPAEDQGDDQADDQGNDDN